MQLGHPEGGGKLLVGTLESTYWGWDKMAAVSQMRSGNRFPCMTILLWFKFNLKLFASAKLIIIYHWLRVMAWCQTGNLNQWWPRSIVQIGMAQPQWVIILTRRQNSPCFVDDNFQCILLNRNIFESNFIGMYFCGWRSCWIQRSISLVKWTGAIQQKSPTWRNIVKRSMMVLLGTMS